MQQESIIVGNQEYTYFKMGAFERNMILLRLKSVALPILGALTKGTKDGQSLMDADLTEAAGAIAEHLTEDVMDNIIFPLLSGCRVYQVEKKTFIKDKLTMNIAFDGDDLMDFYELVFILLKENFAVFFTKLAGHFGSATAAVKPSLQSES